MHQHTEDIDDCLAAIAALSTRLSSFWSSAHGWATREAADLLEQSRLDWLASLNRALTHRVAEVRTSPDEPAALIIGWVHLRALVEGHLKLFLAVFLRDYLADTASPRNRHTGDVVSSEDLSYERIRQFMRKRGLLTEHQSFIDVIQVRGNAVHAFSTRDIGSPAEFLAYVRLYRSFLEDVERSLPTP